SRSLLFLSCFLYKLGTTGNQMGHGPALLTTDVKKKVVVQEGLCIRVPCTFSYAKKKWTDSDLIHGYWFHSGAKIESDSPVATNNPQRPALKETQGRFFLLGDPQMNDCSLDIRKIRKEDTGSYFFRLEREEEKYSYVQNMMTLHVKALTNTPHILIPDTLEHGHPSNLTCSAPWACEPPTFSWTGTSVSLLNTNASLLTIIPQPLDHGTNLTCQVTLPGTGVTTRMTIRLNVSCEEGVWGGVGVGSHLRKQQILRRVAGTETGELCTQAPCFCRPGGRGIC
uniref:Ig-like domain-containing protein n=1 Tax=Peromyscus maniculatus bairdii TaxID=230844 RepID=A0A8C8W549_PERMB